MEFSEEKANYMWRFLEKSDEVKNSQPKIRPKLRRMFLFHLGKYCQKLREDVIEQNQTIEEQNQAIETQKTAFKAEIERVKLVKECLKECTKAFVQVHVQLEFVFKEGEHVDEKEKIAHERNACVGV